MDLRREGLDDYMHVGDIEIICLRYPSTALEDLSIRIGLPLGACFTRSFIYEVYIETSGRS